MNLNAPAQARTCAIGYGFEGFFFGHGPQYHEQLYAHLAARWPRFFGASTTGKTHEARDFKTESERLHSQIRTEKEIIANGESRLLSECGNWSCERYFNALEIRVKEIERQTKKK